jgi:hypothetical protein
LLIAYIYFGGASAGFFFLRPGDMPESIFAWHIEQKRVPLMTIFWQPGV